MVGTASETITLDTTPPHVTISAPVAGAVTAESSVDVSGIVNDIVVGTVNPLQATVAVNGVTAQVANRTYEAMNVPLQLGANTLTATARDRAGNFTSVSTTVTRIPAAGTATLRIVSGDGATGSIRTQLAAPLAVQAFNASGAPIANTPVVFQVITGDGSVSAGSTPGMSAIAVNTNAQGMAQVNYILGSRAGAGNNQVKASATGITATPVFTESATSTGPALIVVDSGGNQSGVVGQALPLPFIAIVTDAGHNRLPNVQVSFTVTQGGGTLNGQNAVNATTDSDGRVEEILTLGPQNGISNNVVTATFAGNAGLPASFTATSYVPGPPQSTSITGVVLDNSSRPIPGVTMRVYQVNNGGSGVPQQVVPSVETNAAGYFNISPAPVGVYKLMADGTTAASGGPFPTLEYDIVTVSGQNNTVGLPIYLQQLKPQNELCVSPSIGGTLTIPEAPGFALTVAPGSAMFPGGSRTGCISVTPVNMDKVPMVPGFGQQPRFIVTIQPVGTIFSIPAQITIPNVDGLKPRAVTEMYSYDHDLASFVAIGSGTVSDDGSVIASDPGVGVLKAGWHCGGDPNSSGSAGSLGVTISPTKIVKGVGTEFNVVASGTPPLDGTYTWELVATQAGDEPDVATLVQSPTCDSMATCTADVKGVKGGKVTLRVHFKCKTNGSEVTADTRITIVQVTSIKVTVPHIVNCSMCAGVAALPDDTFTTINRSTDVTVDTLALPRKSESGNLVCNTTPVNTDPDVLSILKWQIKRNPGSGSVPVLTPSGANATLGFDDQGSFNTFCYTDDNENGSADTNESQISLNLALVAVTVNTLVPTPHSALLKQSTPVADSITISSGTFDHARPDQAGFYLSSTVTLAGGGNDGKLGVDKITVFFMQDFKNDTYVGNYTGSKTAKEVFVCSGAAGTVVCSGSPAFIPFPVIDDDVLYPTGASTPGAVCCHFENPATGVNRSLEWLDSPVFSSTAQQPCDASKTLVSTAGSNNFAVYMLSYGQQMTHSYVAQAEADWTVTVSGAVAADAGGKLIWTKNASSGITATSVTAGYPKNANGAGIMVYGPASIVGSLQTDGR